MKNAKIIFSALIITLSATAAAFSQDAPDSVHQPRPENRAQRPNRPELFRLLQLTDEQTRQIQTLNMERRERLGRAQAAHRQAMQALDRAIYAPELNEAQVEARLRDLQAAQSELSSLRAEMELSVRRLLTAEQLDKFRELRRRFSERRNEQRRGAGIDLKGRPERRMLRERHMPKSN